MAAYGFSRGSAPGGRHYYSADRFAAFYRELLARQLDRRVAWGEAPLATDEELSLFHTQEHIRLVEERCAKGEGALDHGPTPAERGMDIAARAVVGAVASSARAVVAGEVLRAFVPISGFHHGRPDAVRDYCLFNDCAVVLRLLTRELGLQRVAYVDMDVHLGDGVWESFGDDGGVFVADVHQDMRTFWYSDGSEAEPGDRDEDRRLSRALQPKATDADFLRTFENVERFVDRCRPQLIVFASGADCLAEDGLGGLACTEEVHRHATRALRALADAHCGGRMLVLGSGGYALGNLARAWCAVVEELLPAEGGR